ncbi:hypothetical protein K474DRAFT_1679622 [Panus rudis PR-1116 ss-1]|nr:hypothetical protein K474DRAFT_1679622 [Panus rudis PR-1116 ss-1]
MSNGYSSSPRESVAEIKHAAKQQVQKFARGASATTLLRSARDQIAKGHIAEREGDLKEALSAYTKAAALASMFMETSEFKQERQSKASGVLTRDFLNFQQHEGSDLTARSQMVEAKLAEIQAAAPRDADPAPESPSQNVSIADRLRKLQSAGLAVAPTKPSAKRFSRDLGSAASATTPMSPNSQPSSPRPNRISLQGLSSPLPSASSLASSTLASPITASSKLTSPHVLVPTSSLGPPSPGSSPPTSPNVSISDFQHQFPSIDELDERDGLQVPNGTGGSSGSKSSSIHTPSPRPLPIPTLPTTHHPSPRPAFPVLPLDPGPRPSSTPIPPTIDSFVSRPASPADPKRSPLSPTVPRKPSNLGLNNYPQPSSSSSSSSASRSPLLNANSSLASSSSSSSIASTATTVGEKRGDVQIPTTLFPRTLYEWTHKVGNSVLVLDVRPREEFEREHIKADAVVCIEPTVLLRDNVTADTIEDALSLSPKHERTLFHNRDKFELVAIYDQNSQSPSHSNVSPPIQSLIRAIYENSFKKMLKHIPMVLVGGLEAWKREFPDEVVRGGTESAGEVPGSASFHASASSAGMVNGHGHGMNGIGTANSHGLGIGLVNGHNAPAGPSNNNSITASNIVWGPVSITNATHGQGHHTRTPAESGSVPVSISLSSSSHPQAGTFSPPQPFSPPPSLSSQFSPPPLSAQFSPPPLSSQFSPPPVPTPLSPPLHASFPEPVSRNRSGTESGVGNGFSALGVGANGGGVGGGPGVGDVNGNGSGYQMWRPPNNAYDSISPPSRSNLNGDAKENIHPMPSPQPPYADPSKRLVRKAAISRPPSNSVSAQTPPPIPEHTATHHVSASLSNVNGPTSIQYPTVTRPSAISPQTSGSLYGSPSNTPPYASSSSTTTAPNSNGLVSFPPQASINPSLLSRRRSDYIDQSQEALSSVSTRTHIDYPELSSQHILRPPPVAAPPPMERQDSRPRILQPTQPQHPHLSPPKPPTIQSDYPVTYWADIQIGTSGLKNLGNTCYMNSTIQCLSATVPFARFFTDGRWKNAINMMNPMGTKGALAAAFASILRDMWQGEMQCLTPVTFRRSICHYASQFSGNDQHDSQEFLQFLLDGLHEDLNRVLQKPNNNPTPEQEAELERLPMQIGGALEWQRYRERNDSLVVDFFQGQFKNTMQCMTCQKTSTTYNTFMYLTLPIPSTSKSARVTLQQCLDAFVKEEVMEKSDAWNCPSCKTLRKATKRLQLSRLPPVLLIHLKRFSHKGHFTDKIETFVDYPLKALDLTNYMPPPLPPGTNPVQENISRDDPRAQVPPYRYDLYAVTNHFGTLSSGHYTAFIASRGGWLYCDDSRITPADPKDVVGKPAYVLFYKRSKA